jgi:hypothetical protein
MNYMSPETGGIRRYYVDSYMMTSPTESDALTPTEVTSATSSSWARVGLVAAASALVGGLAAAWWYRKTLHTLRQTEEFESNPEFGISSEDGDFDL